MRAGLLRKKVKIQKPLRATDSYGGAAVTWSDVATVPAEVRPTSDRERFFAQQTSPLATHTISIRYRGDLRHDYRALLGPDYTRVLRIVGIRNVDERNRELELTCEEEKI